MARKEGSGDIKQLLISIGVLASLFVILWFASFAFSTFLFSGTYKLRLNTIDAVSFGGDPTLNFGLFNSVTFTEVDENGNTVEYTGTFELDELNFISTDGAYRINLDDYERNDFFEKATITRHGDVYKRAGERSDR